MEFNRFKQLLDKGLDATQALILYYLNTNIDIKEILSNIRIIAVITVLEKRGLVEKLGNDLYQISQKGKELFNDILLKNNPVNTDWVQELYTEIEKIILQNTGKKQHLNKSGKYLKPSSVEQLRVRLLTFFKKFGQQDIEKVKKAILKYTDKVTKGEHIYAVTILYFIFKDGKTAGIYSSELLDWMQDLEEEIVENKQIDTKKLF